MHSKNNIVIAGAGLVGTLLSIFLARKGYRVQLFERRADIRASGMGGGRSINLALSDRGIMALKQIGLYEAVEKIAIPMPGRFIHNIDGTSAWQPYGKENQYIQSVSRSALNCLLLDEAEKAGIDISFSQTCKDINWEHNLVTFQSEKEGITEVAGDVVFGADGAFSAARLQHMLQHPKFDYQQFYIDCGYKELTIPPTPSGDFAMEKNALHIWPRQDYMLIALPNTDGSFTCTLFFPIEGSISFASLDSKEKIYTFFKTNFPDAVALMPELIEEFIENPTSSLVTVKCFPWVRDGHFSLIGDAAHAIVPFFGQGMNCGFEDCLILDQLIEKWEHDWPHILDEFQSLRKPDADAIAELAVNNFIEMRHRTADPMFLLQKKIEALLHEKYPEEWVPAYSQVTFSPNIRYSDALRNGREQESIMEVFMTRPDIMTIWDEPAFHQEIIEAKRNYIDKKLNHPTL
jgi:kynurenine 3-monooxygenase